MSDTLSLYAESILNLAMLDEEAGEEEGEEEVDEEEGEEEGEEEVDEEEGEEEGV